MKPTCKNITCIHPAAKGQVYCSVDCAPLGHLTGKRKNHIRSARMERYFAPEAGEASSQFDEDETEQESSITQPKTTPAEESENVQPQRNDTGETLNDHALKLLQNTGDFLSEYDEPEASEECRQPTEPSQPGSIVESSQTSEQVELHTRNLLLGTSKHLHDLIKSFEPKDMYGIRASAVLASELHKLLRLQFDIIREGRKETRK